MATGTPSDVLTTEMLREVFGVEATIHVDPRTGTPLVMPVGLSGQQPDTTAISDMKSFIAATPMLPVESLHA